MGWNRRIYSAVPIGLICWFLSAPCCASQSDDRCPQPSTVSDSNYAPGQIWSYHSRKEEPDATITILRVESVPKIGVIVHIRLDGIRLRVHSCSGEPEVTEIQHAPFTREALDRSVVKLLRTSDVPAFEWGYQNWLSHCGGVYTISVAEVVAADQQTFDSNMGCRS